MGFSGFKNLQYVKFYLDKKGNKKPLEKSGNFYDLIDLPNWNGLWGFVIPQDIVLIDIDDITVAEIVLKIIQQENVKCVAQKSQSGRGYHFFFRQTQKWIKSWSGIQCLLTLDKIDTKIGGKKNISICCSQGEWCEWLIAPKSNNLLPEELDELPIWLSPLTNLKKIPTKYENFLNLEEGSRNSSLYKYRCFLTANGYDDKQITTTIKKINKYVLNKPLDDKEIGIICRSTEEIEGLKKSLWYDEKNRFKHNLMGDYLIKKLNIFRDEYNCIWFFNGKYYVNDISKLLTEITDLAPQLTKTQKAEVCDYLKTKKYNNITFDINYTNNPYITVKNGYINCETKEFHKGFTPNYFIKTYIDYDYDPNAYDKLVDDFLNDVLVKNCDKQQRDMFEEYLGYTICAKTNFMRKLLLLYGKTATRKSTLLLLVQTLLGKENFSTLEIKHLETENDFILSNLESKLAGIIDDSSGELKQQGTDKLKRYCSSNSRFTINKKFQQPYDAEIYSKFYLAVNEIIKTRANKRLDWYNRLLVLDFKNGLNKKEIQYGYERKLITKNGIKYLLKLAIDGYYRLLTNNQFTISKTSERALTNYMIANDTAYRFFAETYPNYKDLNGKKVDEVYTIYKDSFLPRKYSNVPPRSRDGFIETGLLYCDNKAKVIESKESSIGKTYEVFEVQQD